MPRLERPQQEKLAQQLADGLPGRAACKEAGYATCRGQRLRKRLARPEMVARVAEILAERAKAASDVAPLIARLVEAADAAAALNTAAGYGAMRGLLAEAARLKMLAAGVSPPPPVPPASRRRKLSEAQWQARYASAGAEGAP